jgi:hypothetical protein
VPVQEDLLVKPDLQVQQVLAEQVLLWDKLGNRQ